MATCPTCLNPVADGAPSCPACGTELLDTSPPTRPILAPHARQGTSPVRHPDDSAPPLAATVTGAGRFIAGTMLASRYRIVSLLGSGGMGEVYKADDLKLKQTVALKFLPEAIALDGAALARFHNEVRVARQVTHPNVCRVYDIGEAEGLHFISMEFIDGEDLSSLLRRIGRLPGDKALELARQICAGLAAAHDCAVLHRDLKPANVMIDGRGKARITDFGLAVVSEELRGDEVAAGTPAYMAPEQLRGEAVTVKSDIYSLGLVLYELFTGRRVYESQTLKELMALQDKSDPVTPSSHVKEIDPLTERVILRCLEREPKARPASAVQVALALPGGDPLQAALVLGETPSPEMVAASGEKTGLRPAVAVACLAAIIIGLGLAIWVSSKVNLLEYASLDLPPDALVRQARNISAQLGYTDRPADSVWEFAYNTDYLRYVEKNYPSPKRWQHVQPQAVIFKYRESPQYFQTVFLLGHLPVVTPPATLSGVVEATLDPQGRLLRFSAVPPQADQSTAAALDWAALFRLAGLDPMRFTPAEPQWTPATAFDARAAWAGTAADQPAEALRIEAAAWRGRAVHFEIIYPWSPQTPSEFFLIPYPFSDSSMIVGFIILISATFIARSNHRQGRGDWQGTFKLFCLTFSLPLFTGVLATHLVPTPHRLLHDLILPLALYLSAATLTSLSYFAFEPYVRRYWPNSIISWSRALTGRWRDALVGRDLLIGALVGICFFLLRNLAAYLTGYSNELAPRHNDPSLLLPLLGTRGASGAFFNALQIAVNLSIVTLFLLFLLRALLRRQWLAAGVYILYFMLASPEINYLPGVSAPLLASYGVILVILALRYGLVAVIAAEIANYCLRAFPLTSNVSAWYAGTGMIGPLVVLALAVFAFYTSLGGQKVFEGKLLED